jgi:hypothetical protein
MMGSALSRIVAGAVAGVVGTAVMDLVWYGRYRRGGGNDGFVDWEFATSTASFEEALAPGQVGRKLAGAIGFDLPDEAAARTTNVMHWLTGIGYGIGHGLLQHRRGAVAGGAATGAGAFANSYATLGAIGVYEPIWAYSLATLSKDLTAHLAFGLATGLTFRALSARSA